MTADQLKAIYNEAYSDYSSVTLPSAKLDDLDIRAIANLRKLLKQSGRTEKPIDEFNNEQLLVDLNLVNKNKITIACLVLLGNETSLAKHVPFSEIRYGYKTDESEIRNQDTVIYRKGYLLYYDDIWNKVNSRNLTINIQQGLVITERKAFEEESIREAINNAIVHRDYSESESIIITQTQKDIIISNPGGLPEGITIENMIDRTKPRNKLIADVLQKCGFVETFGNGVNLMFKKQLELGKLPPDYCNTDKYHVVLKLTGEIINPRFTKYVYKIASELNKNLNDEELRFLYQLQSEPKRLPSRKMDNLVRIGIVEKTYDGKYMLSKQYYEYENLRGVYIGRRGLSKEVRLELLKNYFEKYKKGQMKDFVEVFESRISKRQLQRLLNELRDTGLIKFEPIPSPQKGFWRKVKK